MITIYPHVKIDEQMYFELLRKGQGQCAYCGDVVDDKSVIISFKTPASLGGEATLENLLTACKRCEKLKGHKTLDEFRASVFEDISQVIDKAWEVYLKTGFLMDDLSAKDIRRVLIHVKALLKDKILSRDAQFYFETKEERIVVNAFSGLQNEKK
jgi:hypothetical protein